MKKPFRLQSVLRYREVVKEQKRAEFTLAQAEVLDQESRIDGRLKSMTDSLETLSQKLTRASCDPGLLHLVDAYIEGEKFRVKQDREELRSLQFTRDDKLAELVEAQKQVKSLETLKEKRERELKLEYRKKEQKTLDELAQRMKMGRK